MNEQWTSQYWLLIEKCNGHSLIEIKPPWDRRSLFCSLTSSTMSDPSLFQECRNKEVMSFLEPWIGKVEWQALGILWNCLKTFVHISLGRGPTTFIRFQRGLWRAYFNGKTGFNMKELTYSLKQSMQHIPLRGNICISVCITSKNRHRNVSVNLQNNPHSPFLE